MAGHDGEGVILEVSPGVHVVEARVMTYGIGRRICRVRIHPKREIGTLGELAGEVGVDLAAVAICDVDRLAGWAQGHEERVAAMGLSALVRSYHASWPLFMRACEDYRPLYRERFWRRDLSGLLLDA